MVSVTLNEDTCRKYWNGKQKLRWKNKHQLHVKEINEARCNAKLHHLTNLSQLREIIFSSSNQQKRSASPTEDMGPQHSSMALYQESGVLAYAFQSLLCLPQHIWWFSHIAIAHTSGSQPSFIQCPESTSQEVGRNTSYTGEAYFSLLHRNGLAVPASEEKS